MGAVTLLTGLANRIAPVYRWARSRPALAAVVLFAAVYALAHSGQLYKSDHSRVRKFFLTIESMYNAVNLVFSWFAIANFYIFFVILTSSLEDPSFHLWAGISTVNTIINYLFGGTIVACFLFSMGNRPQG